MHPLLAQRAEQICREHDELSEAVADKYDAASAVKLARLAFVVERYREYAKLQEELAELRKMDRELAGPDGDKEMRAMVEADAEATAERLAELKGHLEKRLVPSHTFADKPCLLEIRPGVGGDEAAIFAADILAMYTSYAEHHGWQYSIVSQTRTLAGSGITEAIVSITEPGSYERLQYEAGVHRVQRVPATETKGRMHTSTAAVVVLPQLYSEGDAAEAERQFAPNEVRIERTRSQGSGGQSVNTTDSAIRLTHIPTGIVVSMQDERSQHRNKAKAFMVLQARLAERERAAKAAEERAKRKAQVTTTDRSDKIRTYNYAQNRLTDHRCNFTSYKLAEVMSGERLDDAIDAMDEYTRELQIRDMLGSGDE